jgi:hypothetical protein
VESFQTCSNVRIGAMRTCGYLCTSSRKSRFKRTGYRKGNQGTGRSDSRGRHRRSDWRGSRLARGHRRTGNFPVWVLLSRPGNHGGARWRRRFHRCTRWHGPPEYEAKRYEGHLQKGGILLAVHCDTSEEIDEAKEIMQRTDAEDISSTSESSANIRRHMLPRRKQERAIEVSRDRESAAAKRQSSWPPSGARGIPSSKDHCS